MCIRDRCEVAGLFPGYMDALAVCEVVAVFGVVVALEMCIRDRIEQRGSFFSGKSHPGIFPWIPRVRIIANRIIRINQKAFAGVNGESFFMIFDKALPCLLYTSELSL